MSCLERTIGPRDVFKPDHAIGPVERRKGFKMPGNVHPVADEREGLLAYLDQQRYVLRLTAYGLNDGQARKTPLRSKLCLGGLIKHVTSVERFWMDVVLERVADADAEQDYDAGFRLGPHESLAEALDDYAEVARATEVVIASIYDLGQSVPVPHEVPWFPKDVAAWSVRWVLLHLIEETARHAGHADIIREALDGATAFPLMAAAESWPASPWMKPWKPDGET
jgi:uncharacterized damage-inducible protein DinB